MNRKLAAIASLCVLTAAVGLAAPHAHATRRNLMTVSLESPQAASYPAIVQAFPYSRFGAPDPEHCNPAVYCDTIPMRIVPPKLASISDDYLVEIVITWPGQSQLDVWLWDNKQTKNEFGKKQPTDGGYTTQDASDYTVIANKASGKSPVRLEIAEPRLVDYNLTVLNFNGINQGYSVAARMTLDIFDPPPESQEEELVPTTTSDEGGSSDFAAITTFEPAAAPDFARPDAPAAEATTAPALSTVDLGSDPLLSSIKGTDLASELAAPLLTVTGPERVVKPPPPSGAVLGFWLLAVPAVAGAGGVAMLSRRRRSAFTIA